jgi:hypothetical protein
MVEVISLALGSFVTSIFLLRNAEVKYKIAGQEKW